MRACTEPDSCGCVFISALHAGSHSAGSVCAPHLCFIPSPPGFVRAGRTGQQIPGLPRVPSKHAHRAGSRRAVRCGAAEFPICRSAPAGGCCWPEREMLTPGASSISGAPWAGRLLAGSPARSPAPGRRAARDGGVGCRGLSTLTAAEAQPAHSSGLLVTRLLLPWAISCVSPESSWLTFCLPGDSFSAAESQAGRWHSVYGLSASPQGRAKTVDT